MTSSVLRHLSFRAQLLVLLVVIIVFAQLVSFYILDRDQSITYEQVRRISVVEGIQTLVSVIDEIPDELLESVLDAAGEGRTHYQLTALPAIDSVDPSTQELTDKLARMLGIAPAQVRTHMGSLLSEEECTGIVRKLEFSATGIDRALLQRRNKCVSELVVSVDLGDEGWLNVYTTVLGPIYHFSRKVLFGLGLTVIATVLMGGFVVNRVAGPLRDLSRASERVGRGENVVAINPRGPKDLQIAINTFNTMQKRVQAFAQDQSRLLAAISHDIRTPVTSMRLRVELLADSEDKNKLLASLSDMEDITSTTLDFLGESSIREPLEEVDLNALLMSLCEDLIEQGLSVQYQEAERNVYRCRRSALKRALSNIIDNAIKYGSSATILMRSLPDHSEICVSDEGPGVPRNDMENVFKPFVRLEYSRNRQTGGIGLGLAIARSIVRNHGGDIFVRPATSQRKFCIQIVLPKSDAGMEVP